MPERRRGARRGLEDACVFYYFVLGRERESRSHESRRPRNFLCRFVGLFAHSCPPWWCVRGRSGFKQAHRSRLSSYQYSPTDARASAGILRSTLTMTNCSLWTLSSRVHLYTFASIEEYVLLHHFLAHYRSQGVRLQTNAHIILHAMDAESSNSFMAVARQVASSHGVLDVSEVH